MFLLSSQRIQKVQRNIVQCFSSWSVFKIKFLLYGRLTVQTVLIWIGLTPQEKRFQNRENEINFNFVLSSSPKRAGTSAFLRVKNEETKILYCLRSIIGVFDEIVFVDNGSEDSTLELIKNFKQEHDKDDKLKIYSYPWGISRLGSEHESTPENSIHSLVYYYNWTLSHCTYQYVCKWDADMVLNKDIADKFKSFLKTEVLQGKQQCYLIPGLTVYRSLDDRFFHKNELNKEPRLFPISCLNRYWKDEFWEVLRCLPPLPIKEFKEIVFYELKFSDEVEFSHWSTLHFSTPFALLHRPQQELKNLQRIQEGNIDESEFASLDASFLEASTSL